MENENISKYLPLVVSGVALLLGLNNKGRIAKLEGRVSRGFDNIAEGLNDFEVFKQKSYDNFKIIQRDMNKIGHFVGFKGRLGVNE